MGQLDMSDLMIPMLKACVKMLEGCKPDKVDCARTILSEIITDLEKVPIYATRGSLATGPAVGASSEVDEDLDPEALAAKEE